MLDLFCFPGTAICPNEAADAAGYSSSFEKLKVEAKNPWAHFGRRICRSADPVEPAAFWLPGSRAFHRTQQIKICRLRLLPRIWGDGLHLLNGASICFDYLEFLTVS